MIASVAAVLFAYVVGMFPTASLVGRRSGRDPSVEGSGNPGASNVYRLAGRRAGLFVGAVDLAKGVVPTLVALVLLDRETAHAAWLAAVAGHVWPAARRFRGGKGVATAGGGGLVLAPALGLACAAAFLLVVRTTKVAALGSLAIAFTYPALTVLVQRPVWETVVGATVAAVLVLRHRGNIARILRREEHSLGSTQAP